MVVIWGVIKEWSLMTPQKQLKVILISTIAIMCYVVVHYENRILGKDEEIKELNKNHIRYIEKSEQEFKDLYIDLQNLKR